MSLSDRLEQGRRDFQAMRAAAQDARATLDEIHAALRIYKTVAGRGVLAIAFLLGVLGRQACVTFLGI